MSNFVNPNFGNSPPLNNPPPNLQPGFQLPSYPPAPQISVTMSYPQSPQSGYPTPAQPAAYGDFSQPGGAYPTPQQPAAYGNFQQPGGAGMQPQIGVVPQQPAVCPSAPDLGQMEKIPGYEGTGFEDAVLPPPSFPTWEPNDQDVKPMQNLPAFSDEDVHEAVAQYIAEHCCYPSKVAKDMDVKEIQMISGFHYKLETFTEKRESAWRFIPYTGQAIDGPTNGPAPNPWDITSLPPSNFQNSKGKLEVPHTAFVKPCHTCVGNGRVRCDNCTGQGQKQCTWCKGRGNDGNVRCNPCNGSGWSRCIRCSGTGQVKCKTCDGRGNLKGFVELTITWTNHVDDFISETSRMPKELVLQVTGQVAYEEENPRVFPIMHATEQAVRHASTDLVNKHTSSFVNERILKQRQCLRIIPIGQIKYEWKDKSGEFFVYGYEHKVYFKSFPQKCACTIM